MEKNIKMKDIKELGEQLGELQRVCREKKIPVMIAFEGYGAAGKGLQIGNLIQALDPRGFKVYAVKNETEEEWMHPFMWRFWTKIPEKGRIAIFDTSWYRRVMIERFEGKTPEKELEVRARIEYMKGKNARGDDDFDLVVFDLYDVIIDFLEKKRFLEKCYDFEKKNGMERITKAVTNAMKINDNDSLIVQYIKEHTPENAIVFLTGIGKCYPILRSHKVLNNLHQAFVRCPVVMFFPGTYNEQELILFNEIKDDNYYRAFRLVK